MVAANEGIVAAVANLLLVSARVGTVCFNANK